VVEREECQAALLQNPKASKEWEKEGPKIWMMMMMALVLESEAVQ